MTWNKDLDDGRSQPSDSLGRMLWAKGIVRGKSRSRNRLCVPKTAVANQGPCARADEPGEGKGWERRGRWNHGGLLGRDPRVCRGGGRVGL